MGSAQELYTGRFILFHETEGGTQDDGALLLGTEGQTRDEGEWVPKSQVSKILRRPGSREVEVTMAKWIAKSRGFI
jgi:hypothetical protein